MSAAEAGDGPLVDLLLSRGAVVNAQAENGETALHLAARQDHGSVVRHLIQVGAAPGTFTREGFAPIHYAAAGEALESIRALLAIGTTPDSHQPGGPTPLMVAVRFSRSRAVSLLLAKGADPGYVDGSGKGAVQLAREKGWRYGLELLRHGTSPGRARRREPRFEAPVVGLYGTSYIRLTGPCSR
jgi:ankyrin repeat protein